MKLQIVLFGLAAIAIALCSSSEKIKGRRSNLRIDQLSREGKDSLSKARFFNKKGSQSSQPTVIIVEKEPVAYSSPEYYFSGYITTSPANRSLSADDDDFLDSEDEVENEQASRRSEKRNNNLKLKKINRKTQVYRLDVPANSATSNKGVNNFQKLRLSGNNKYNRYPDNVPVRRFVTQQ